jgi:uncharacterized protein (DUF2141 family)
MSYFVMLVICTFFTGIYPENLSISFFGTDTSEGIDLTINNIRNKTGVIQIGIFDSEAGYPDKPVYSFTLAKDTILNSRLRIFIPLGEKGAIGITVLDDENKNKKMDYVFGIKPKEGFGFSNNPAVPGRKPPPFSATRINYTGGRLRVTINMKYV